jgi:hypothetical protein
LAKCTNTLVIATVGDATVGVPDGNSGHACMLGMSPT